MLFLNVWRHASDRDPQLCNLLIITNLWPLTFGDRATNLQTHVFGTNLKTNRTNATRNRSPKPGSGNPQFHKNNIKLMTTDGRCTNNDGATVVRLRTTREQYSEPTNRRQREYVIAIFYHPPSPPLLLNDRESVEFTSSDKLIIYYIVQYFNTYYYY